VSQLTRGSSRRVVYAPAFITGTSSEFMGRKPLPRVLRQRRITVVLGPEGVGKSTVARALAAGIPPLELDAKQLETQFNARVRQSLQKCVAKIEKNQMKDGSWNLAGGWAPILGTSMASQSLDMARAKGVPVAPATMAKVTEYTKQAGAQSAGGVRSEASAGVSLYQKAQELEQLSRTAKDRKDNAREIDAIKDQLTESKFVSGYGSIGGEEFFSYLNISESLKRTGGPEWEKWHGNMKDKIVKLQNQDGTWAGHHCITGRVAVTSAAILTLLADRQPAVLSSAAKVR